MKGNKIILIIAFLLLLFTVNFTTYTYAIYRESATATGSIETASWSVKIKKTGTSGEGTAFSTAILAFDASDIIWTNHTGKNGKIAPGDSGTISFDVNALGSEVDVILETSIGNVSGLPNGMTATVTSGTNGVQEIPYSTTSMTSTVVITVTWTGTIADASSKDTTDLAAQGSNLSIPLVLTARQKMASD